MPTLLTNCYWRFPGMLDPDLTHEIYKVDPNPTSKNGVGSESNPQKPGLNPTLNPRFEKGRIYSMPAFSSRIQIIY